ncbi:hypothetical protein ALSL_0310 [Aerosticca soli]|uniref:Uncharacterized protein n=1 Tax=Aerosticca soli TaxID=2010829 RepID=A0A2Z6E1V9_9GAMM|nr:hypothetical protein ALSL_0310 [Aerosticca soli]
MTTPRQTAACRWHGGCTTLGALSRAKAARSLRAPRRTDRGPATRREGEQAASEPSDAAIFCFRLMPRPAVAALRKKIWRPAVFRNRGNPG